MPRPLRIGITCYPSVGGSGILATELGEDLARRGHDVHFISYERPFRLPPSSPRITFHPVSINDYGLFKYPDYTLPLSVKMAEVSHDHRLDLLHVHYAVPHATAALLARSMLPPNERPRIITTLHGTDTTLLGRDPHYAPAIRHALDHSDAITTVSHWLREETQRLLNPKRPIEVIHNFFTPSPPRRTRSQVRQELGLRDDQSLLIHLSNLRPVKRIDLLLTAVSQLRPRDAFKLLILAGDPFAPFDPEVRRLGLADQVIVRERVEDIEDYLQAADINLVTSDTESFCLSILEAMCFACPTIATNVGGIPEVITPHQTGLLVPPNDPPTLTQTIQSLLNNPTLRTTLGRSAQQSAHSRFSADTIVPQYESLYHRTCASPTHPSLSET